MLSFDYRFILPVFGILIWAFKKGTNPIYQIKGIYKIRFDNISIKFAYLSTFLAYFGK